MSSNLTIRFIHPDANGRGREPLEEVLAHGTEKLAFACAFMTDAGYEIISPHLALIDKPGSFAVVSIQQPTSREALEDLFAKHPGNVFVHLGTIFDYFEAGSYVGLMHSKLFLASDGRTTKVFCGSHNLTASALLGFNLEAATIIEGPADDPFFIDVETHLNDCREKSADILPERETAQNKRLIIELEVDDPIDFIEKVTRLHFIKFSPKGTKDQPALTPDSLFTILLFKRGTLHPDEPAPVAIAYINGLVTALNLGPNSPQKGVNAVFDKIHLTITENPPGSFVLTSGNLPTAEPMSAALKPRSWGTGGGIYLLRSPSSETEVVESYNCMQNIEESMTATDSDHQMRRPKEPKIDDDIKAYFKRRPDIIDSLVSRKRYWISRWKRRFST